MFISKNILDWNFFTENGSGLSFDKEEQIVWRAHEIWRHAISLISAECSEFSRGDAISNLKRAINHRLQALSNAYSFDALPFSNRRQTLEKLQFYGLVRPALIKELFEIRNAIEHNDGAPPTVDQCKRYGDFVWYFLKSTDSLLLMHVDDIQFWSPESDGRLTFLPTFDGCWRIIVQGRLPPQFIHDSCTPDSLELDESCEQPAYTPPPIYGLWKPTSEQLTRFARTYFGLSGYWWEDHV